MATHLTLVGIDEAGYGPRLGPLCVAMSAVRVPMVVGEAGQPVVPNLWQLLERGVCDTPGRGGKSDPAGRIAIADSKKLKLSSSVTTTHPLVHLERGVLCALAVMHDDGAILTSDAELFAKLHAAYPDEPWYRGDTLALPQAHDAGLLAIAANQLRRTLHGADTSLLSLRCRLLGEREFNTLAKAGGKAATTAAALRGFLRHAWDTWGACVTPGHASLGIVCDRQGGRAAYAEFLGRVLPEATITTIEESATRSRYIIEGTGDDGIARRAGVSFLVEAESHHLPVALASMAAKLTRELAMQRFNRAWSVLARERAQLELKPTAGYALDAQRWLREMRSVVTRTERATLVRVR